MVRDMLISLSPKSDPKSVYSIFQSVAGSAPPPPPALTLQLFFPRKSTVYAN